MNTRYEFDYTSTLYNLALRAVVVGVVTLAALTTEPTDPKPLTSAQVLVHTGEGEAAEQPATF